MAGLLGIPGLDGFMAQRQMAGQEQNQQLQQAQGLLSMQQAMQGQQDAQRMNGLKGLLGQKIQAGDMQGANAILAQLDPIGVAKGMQPKPPKWQETRMKRPDGSVEVGYVDINSPTPESTFRARGVEPVRMENVNGAFVNPYQPPTAPIPSPTNPFNVVPDGKGGYSLAPNQPVQDFQMRKAGAGAARISQTVNPALDPFKNEKSLRDEFKSNPVVKNADEMGGAFRLIETAYKNPTPANDLAMATKYMKILDPTSVVRESELALAMGAVGLIDKVYNYANLVASGEKLTPTQRKDFYDSAKAINEAFQQERGKVAEQYKGIAGQYNLSPQNVTLDRPGAGGPKFLGFE